MSKRAGSTVVEVKGSHAIYVSQHGAVAALIPSSITIAADKGRGSTSKLSMVCGLLFSRTTKSSFERPVMSLPRNREPLRVQRLRVQRPDLVG